MAQRLEFYFDLSCPDSFMISTLINELCSKHNVTATWRPFLTQVTSSKPYTSAANKLKYNQRLRLFYAQRILPNNRECWHRLQDQQAPQTLDEMIFLSSIADASNATMIHTAKQLFRSTWIRRDTRFTQIVQQFKESANYMQSYRKLQRNTKAAYEQHNLFAAPMVLINEQHAFYGVDRLPNIEALLRKQQFALDLSPISRVTFGLVAGGHSNELEFYFDFSSPWAYLGYCRLHELRGFAEKITFKPILLGALFRDIGTPNAPALAMDAKRREYGSVEIERWREIAGVPLQWNKHFPIRTVLPLRVFIINQKTIDCMYRGAWQWNVNIGDESELCKLLQKFGFDGEALIEQAKNDKNVKQILKNNTEFARNTGMFGVPSYVVNGDYDRFVWGQDKLDLVKDLCCGWKPLSKCDKSICSKL